MSDMQYGIDISIRNGISNLKKFKKAADSFDKGRESALKRQIALLQKMKNLQAQAAKPMKPPTSSGGAPKPKPTDDFVGPRIDKNTQNFLKKQAKERYAAEQKVTKEKMRQERIDAQRLSSLEKTRATIMNSALMTEKEANAAHRTAQENIRSRLAKAKTSAEMRKIVAQERASLRLAKKKSFLVSRMEASSKEFAGNMVSAFAVAAGGVFITQTGQNFESAANTMLSVSDNAQQAGENMQFVKDEAFRLGLGLTQATKGFAKLNAARGNLSLEDTKELFTGVSELSTVLGLTAEESNRALLAIQQMSSKGKISAEELRLQLGEVLPQGIQLMADAAYQAGLTTDRTVASMSKLMEEGKLLSEDVLPFFATNMRIAASAGGALDKALLSNRVAMNRLVTATQNAADTIFQSGWGEGLTLLFNSLAEMIKENETLFTEFGKTMGKVFKGLAWLVENVLDPALSALGSILQFANESIGGAITSISGLTAMLVKMSPVLSAVVERFGGLKTVGKAIGFIARRMFLPFYLGLGVLEEIAEFFSPTGKKTLLRFNIDDIANPFESWREEIDYIWDKMMAVGKFFGMGSTQDIGTTRGVLPYNHEAFMQPRQQSVFQPSQAPIHVTVDIDGNKVAEAVATKPAMAETMNRAMNKAFDPNYR